MPISTRSRAAKTEVVGTSNDNAKRSKRAKGDEDEASRSSPPGGGKRKVARAVRKMQVQEERDSLSDFKLPAAVGTSGRGLDRHARCGSHDDPVARFVAPPKVSKAKGRKKPPPKQPTLLESSDDEVELLQVHGRRGRIRSVSKTKDQEEVLLKDNVTANSNASTSSASSSGTTKGRGRTKKQLVTSEDSSSILSLTTSPAAAATTKNGGKSRTRTKKVAARVIESEDEELFAPVSPVRRTSARLRKNEADSSRDSIVSVASTKSTRSTNARGKKKAQPEVILLTDESADEREIAGASLAAQATKKATAKGSRKKKEGKQEEAVLMPPPKPTRQLRDRSKVNNSNGNISSEVEKPKTPIKPNKSANLQTTDKSTASGKENATPSKGKLITLLSAKGEPIALNADVFASQCRTHAQLVLQTHAKVVPLFDPALMKEMKSLQDEFRNVAKSKIPESVPSPVKEEKKDVPLPPNVDTEEDEDLFKEFDEGEGEKPVAATDTEKHDDKPELIDSVDQRDEDVEETKNGSASRKRGRSPEIVESVETTKIGKDLVTFDFQAAAAVMKQPKDVPVIKKCAIEVVRCDDERMSEENAPVSVPVTAAFDATFAQQPSQMMNIPTIALDATFVMKPPTVREKVVNLDSTYVKDAPSPGRKSTRNSEKSVTSEVSQYYDAVQSPLAKRIEIEILNEETEDADSSASLFESSQLVPPTPPLSLQKHKIVVPENSNNDTICLTNPSFLPKSALQPPSAALRLGPWLPAVPATGLDAVMEEDSQDSVKSLSQPPRNKSIEGKDLIANLPSDKFSEKQRRVEGATSSSSSSSSSSSFKSAKCFPSSATGKTIKSILPPKEVFNFTQKNAMKREMEAQKKKDEIIQQKKDIQQKKNEEWAKRAEKIRLEELRKREEAEKKLEREEAERKLQQEEAAKKQKPPFIPTSSKPKIQPVTLPKAAFGQSLVTKFPESQAGYSNGGFKASGPMSGFKSASSEQKLAFQSKLKMVTALSTPKLSNPAKITGGTTHSPVVFKVPEAPMPNYNYSFLDTTHEGSYVSSYEITRYEDLDEELKHREDKHVPEWALNKHDLACALFKQSLMGQFPSARTPFPKPDKKYKLFK